MRDKLINLLGGYSSQDYHFLEVQLEMMRNQAVAVSNNSEFLKVNLQAKDEHILYLENLIFREHGLLHGEEQQIRQDINLRPINTKPRSIFQTMRAMQRDDSLRARSSRQESPLEELPDA